MNALAALCAAGSTQHCRPGVHGSATQVSKNELLLQGEVDRECARVGVRVMVCLCEGVPV